MAKMTLTRDIANAIAMDYANRQMRKAGRTAWSEDDYNLAVETFEGLWPVWRDLGMTEDEYRRAESPR